MTMPPAERVAALLRARYPDGEISVVQEPDGLAIKVHIGEDSSNLFASIGDEYSALLVVLDKSQQTR